MNSRDYEIAYYAQTVWRLARSSDEQELLAIACTIRNHVIPRLGMVSIYPTFSAACEDFLTAYPLRELPKSVGDLEFYRVDPQYGPRGLLAEINGIYNCETPDLTATQDKPAGAKYFGRASEFQLNPDLQSNWFYLEVLSRPGLHPLLGTFGSLQFFA